MNSVRIGLAAALGVLLTCAGPQALAQFARTGPRVTGNGVHTVAPAPVPVPEVAPVTVQAAKPPPPAKSEFPPVDGAIPGNVLGLGDEGVGPLVRPAEAPPGPLAESKAEPVQVTGTLGDGSASLLVSPPAPAATARAAAPHHAHRRRAHPAAQQPQS